MRVNVETRAIRASARLATRLGMNQAEALGRLVFLWESSQDEEVTQAFPIDLVTWCFPVTIECVLTS
jgi:hemolysin-activating ACP:hemolysin acyltransferase